MSHRRQNANATIVFRHIETTAVGAGLQATELSDDVDVSGATDENYDDVG
jgi:hypothetical protein